ncbi:hypothetical protein CLOM_g23392, partial [Closterium sp. NIES-68]
LSALKAALGSIRPPRSHHPALRAPSSRPPRSHHSALRAPIIPPSALPSFRPPRSIIPRSHHSALRAPIIPLLPPIKQRRGHHIARPSPEPSTKARQARRGAEEASPAARACSETNPTRASLNHRRGHSLRYGVRPSPASALVAPRIRGRRR